MAGEYVQSVTKRQGNVITPGLSFSEKEKLAAAIAKSNLFGMKTPEQALVLMALCEAEGLHPVIAVRDFHVINGKPALKADAMLARFQQAGGKVHWNDYSDAIVSGTFSHPAGGSATVAWTIAQAKAAGLTGKDVWKQYPRAMLRARVISEGIRTVYPGVSVGVYTPEELQDFDSKPVAQEVKAEVKNVEPKLAAPAIPVSSDPASSEDDRDQAFKALTKSPWSRDELVSYCQAAFGVSASKDLTTKQVWDLAQVSTAISFQNAMLAIEDAVL
jgi:hypothetical protein